MLARGWKMGGQMNDPEERPADDPVTGRLDNFVDGAFAFALTLLVIAGGEQTIIYSDLIEAIRRIPVFAAGFGLIAMFWYAHVSWRRSGGRNDGVSVLLSLMLVFTVLIYVHPMRFMVYAFVDFWTGSKALGRFPPDELFTIYGLGFAAMAGLVCALFAHGRRAGHVRDTHSDAPTVWGVVAGAGLLSAALAQAKATMFFAPWTYWLLPVMIPLALRLQRRRPTPVESVPNEGDQPIL